MSIGGSAETHGSVPETRYRAGGVNAAGPGSDREGLNDPDQACANHMHSGPERVRSLGFMVSTSSDIMSEEVDTMIPRLRPCSDRLSTRRHDL